MKKNNGITLIALVINNDARAFSQIVSKDYPTMQKSTNDMLFIGR